MQLNLTLNCFEHSVVSPERNKHPLKLISVFVASKISHQEIKSLCLLLKEQQDNINCEH